MAVEIKALTIIDILSLIGNFVNYFKVGGRIKPTMCRECCRGRDCNMFVGKKFASHLDLLLHTTAHGLFLGPESSSQNYVPRLLQ